MRHHLNIKITDTYIIYATLTPNSYQPHTRTSDAVDLALHDVHGAVVDVSRLLPAVLVVWTGVHVTTSRGQRKHAVERIHIVSK